MKHWFIIVTMALTASTVTLAAGNHDHAPKHGGVVVETKGADFEIVAKPDAIHIYASDHGKPLKLDGGKAKVTLLNGSDRTEVDLLPSGDRLEAKGNFKVGKGTKGVAVVTLVDKPASTARFEIK